MNRYIFVIALLIISYSTNAQRIDSLIKEFQKYEYRDYRNAEELAKKIFKIDPFNSSACFYLSDSYDQNNQLKRKKRFFKRLKEKYPNQPEPWLLSAEFNHWALSSKDTISYADLNNALLIDSTNAIGYFLYAKTLYRHSQRFYKNDSISYSIKIAKRARENMTNAIKYDSTYYNSLRLPIYQISFLVGDSIYYQQFLRSNNQNWCYQIDYPYEFPLDDFINLPNNWQSNFTYDLQRIARATERKLTTYSNALVAFGEEKLCANNDDIVIRFIWLRTFHNPVTISIRKNETLIELTWKIIEGGEGNSSNRIVNLNQRILMESEWMKFTQCLDNTDFWNLETTSSDTGFDGSNWIIEGIEEGQYQIVDRWTPNNSTFAEIGKLLIKLTDLNISKNEIY